VPRPAVAVAALACAGLLAGCAGDVGVASGGATDPKLGVVDPGPSGVFAPDARRPAPELRGTTLDGTALDLASMRGSVVVVNFWASWCAPCRAESPNLVAVSEATRDSGVRFVGVNVKDDHDDAVRFDRVHDVGYPSLYDQPGTLLTRFREYAPQTPPTTLVLDRQGRVAARFIGGVTETELLGPVTVLAREA